MGEPNRFFRRCFSLYFDFQLPFGIERRFHCGSGERWIISIIGFDVTISLIIVFLVVSGRAIVEFFKIYLDWLSSKI